MIGLFLTMEDILLFIGLVSTLDVFYYYKMCLNVSQNDDYAYYVPQSNA